MHDTGEFPYTSAAMLTSPKQKFWLGVVNSTCLQL